MTSNPLRVAIIGTAARSNYLYGPIVKSLLEGVELVAVWGRRDEPARRLGESLGVPCYVLLSVLVAEEPRAEYAEYV